ncbi:MAG: CPXCG motif-containing cysteine-rich protein [Gammaproteobacteria bacterium]|nr:CPXCG motif-containing cysteine-rich protein [Gammaproteobacteria bacterium]
MRSQEEAVIQCPYCGESIDVLIDCSVADQQYIEDCQVCCRPINFSVRVDDTAGFTLQVYHENE